MLDLVPHQGLCCDDEYSYIGRQINRRTT